MRKSRKFYVTIEMDCDSKSTETYFRKNQFKIGEHVTEIGYPIRKTSYPLKAKIVSSFGVEYKD